MPGRSEQAVLYETACQNQETFWKVGRGKTAFSEWMFGLLLGYLCWLLRTPGCFMVNSTCVDQGFYKQTDEVKSR